MAQQHTIKQKASISGIGLHTGQEVTLTFLPAPINHGICFKRIDLESQPIIEADVKYVTETDRGTTLDKKGAKLQTIEHVLAACTGLKIDNIIVTDQKKILRQSDFKDDILKISYGKKKHYLIKINNHA